MRSTSDNVKLWLPEAKATAFAGSSLAKTLYGPVTVFLRGELGAGKTTFLQGFGQGLGLGELLKSPTYALEQRYGAGGNTLLHVDLYRLSEQDAAALVASSADFPGIRCIEWSERLTKVPDVPGIDVFLSEEKSGRRLEIAFRDAPLPRNGDIERWRDDTRLPDHIRRHCDAVADTAVRFADALLERGTIVRRSMVESGGRVHDLFRFLDFRPGADPPGSVTTDGDRTAWDAWRKRFPGMRHEAAVEAFLQESGYGALGEAVAVHGLQMPSPERRTTEQKLLFYADKRVAEDRFVTLRERFDDFQRRYAGSKESAQSVFWFDEAESAERALFPEGVPF